MSVRRGGVSPAPWNTLNLGALCGDSPAHVARNRQLFAAAAGMPRPPRFLHQVHGAEVIEWSGARGEAQRQIIHADAHITATPGQPLAVLAADCLPVLLTDEQGVIVSAAHAGWRGVLAGVLTRSVREMRSRLPTGRGLLAWIGPGIGPCCFEVGPEVRALFIGKNQASARHFRPSVKNSAMHPSERWLANLGAIAADQLLERNVRVSRDTQCTVCYPERFFSYRRDGVTGRMAAAIWRR